MKTNIEQVTIGLSVFALVVASMVPSAHAQQCSLAGAAGKYGFSDSGTIIRVGQRAAVGTLTFDAAGKISGSVTANLNGSVSQTTLSGTYNVEPDCTGTANFSELDESEHLILTATVAIVWDTNMREARFIFTSVALADGTSLSTVISGNARKLAPVRPVEM